MNYPNDHNTEARNTMTITMMKGIITSLKNAVIDKNNVGNNIGITMREEK